MVTLKPHRCDESCTCPHHGTPLLYSPATFDHACQDPSCEFAHGMFSILLARIGPPPPDPPADPRRDPRYARAFARITEGYSGAAMVDRLTEARRKGWVTPEWATLMIEDARRWHWPANP